ncbi:MAG: tRNA (adenosine(37)-N6)-threonylcarbamoyltransferase complex dimerization subunit type 1 TsaB [Planctomycetota bacterium]
MTAGESRLVVALETSTRTPSVAASLKGGRVCLRTLDGERSHASDLLVELEAAVAEVGATKDDLDVVVVGTGPGSYTGLRVGAATALGLHRGAEAALVAVPSFEAIACAGLRPGDAGAVFANAFGGQVYAAAYQRQPEGSGVRATIEPKCVDAAAARAELIGADAAFADPGALSAMGLSGGEVPGSVRVDVVPRADVLLSVGLEALRERGADDPARVRPLYLRPFEVKMRGR